MFAINRENILSMGGNAMVFEGVWDGNPVAIKRMELFKTKYDQRMVEALKELNHPNIVKLFHDQSDENFRFYFLELCSASLDQVFLEDGDRRQYNGPMPSPENVLSQLAKGLEYIHKMGLVHRNIKPENVLIWVNPENGQVLMKWADFGLSKPVNERGSHSMSGVRGTDEWLAPELLKILDDTAANADERKAKQRGTIQTDVFTEGLVFGYYLMGGVHLYGSGFDIPMNIKNNELKNLDENKLGFANGLIMKMLLVQPEERITSSQVVEHLVKLAEEQQKVKFDFEIKVNVQVTLGSGGFGVVFQGEWNNEKVAVKRIIKSASTTRDEQEEEKALKKLDHPNVIKLLHVESDNTFKYYALELCEASLDKLFLKDGDSKKYRGPMPATIDVLCQLAVGLEYIHKMGFIHRDISPQNILIWVNPENTKKVLMKWTDFGLSRQVNATGSFYTSRHKGKEYWLAPEILELSDNNSSSSKSARQKGNYSSDVYAEGLIFGHILLNGRKYHIFGKPTEIKYFITTNNQVNIKDIEPESYRQLIENMIKFEPEKRISSEQVADRLITIKNQTPH